MIKRYLIGTLMVLLALHLVYTNSDLLIAMDKPEADKWMKIVFASSYSVLTVLIMTIYPQLWLLVILSIFDGFGVYLKYNVYQTHFLMIASVYFGLYTSLIVISAGLAQRVKPKKRYRNGRTTK